MLVKSGHGGFDGGAVAADGTYEKDLNLEISRYLYDFCSLNGYTAECVRTDDSSVEDPGLDTIRKKKNSDLNNRLKLMEKYENEIYISIHMNKFSDTSVKGAQLFYSPTFTSAADMAYAVKNEMLAIRPENDRPIKSATKDAYIIYNAKCPSLIIECGFMSNPDELVKLKTPDYQRKIAYAIFLGITEYVSEVKK